MRLGTEFAPAAGANELDADCVISGVVRFFWPESSLERIDLSLDGISHISDKITIADA